jgi:putative ABC transport system ATP-binding protein
LPTIRVRGVTKTYVSGSRRIEALRGVDLDIAEPGFYGIMGPSGSGKSTLLHLLAALDRPDSGAIEVAGCTLDSMSESELTLFRRRRIGIVFQQFNLISTLNALNNVTLPALLDGMSAARRHRTRPAL